MPFYYKEFMFFQRKKRRKMECYMQLSNFMGFILFSLKIQRNVSPLSKTNSMKHLKKAINLFCIFSHWLCDCTKASVEMIFTSWKSFTNIAQGKFFKVLWIDVEAELYYLSNRMTSISISINFLNSLHIVSIRKSLTLNWHTFILSFIYINAGGKPITPNDVTDSLTNGRTTENGGVAETVTKSEVSIDFRKNFDCIHKF